MPDALLTVRSLSYRYPGRERPALNAVSLEVAEGELVLLAGASGSGKSTLLRAAGGLVPHFFGGDLQGSVATGGLDTREHGPAEVALVAASLFQDPEAQVVMNGVRAEVELPLANRGIVGPAAARAVEEAALALGADGLLERQVRTLSGGELQRVALAASLVTEPRLLLLDEPTSQLDPVAGDELVSQLRRLNEQWGTAVVLAEHRLERCLHAADRVVALDGGAVAFDGPPGAFAAWAEDHAAALAPPAARMFALAGLRPLPVGVKDARAALRAGGLEKPAAGEDAGRAPFSAPQRSRRRRGAAGSQPALSLERVWVEYDDGTGAGHAALRGVDLGMEPGETVALLGRNGAGKSTLLRAAAGLAEPSRGRVRAAGPVALLTQSPSDYFLRERVADELPPGSAAAALAELGLESLAGEDPHDLSGGERQRLALAIVLAGRGIGGGEPPPVVALDEPTRGMDRERKARLAGLLATLAGSGAAVVAATHDVEFAAQFAQRCVLLGRGRVVADGPVREVLSGGLHFSTEVARVLGPGGGVVLPEEGARVLLGRAAARRGTGEPSSAGQVTA